MDLDEWLAAEIGAHTEFTSPNFTLTEPTMHTVSPQDLDLSMQRVPSSAPNSAAWTSLTSPLLDSPLDSFETSPLFPTDGLDGPESWEPLFPDAQSFGMEHCLSNEGVFINPVEAENPKSSDVLPLSVTSAPSALLMGEDEQDNSSNSPSASPLVRTISSSGSSGRSKHRHSSVSGVASSRKRSGPLPPIVVEDPADIVAVKRARNTLAARKSRARRVEKFDEMEKRIEELESEVEHWKRLAQANP